MFIFKIYNMYPDYKHIREINKQHSFIIRESDVKLSF